MLVGATAAPVVTGTGHVVLLVGNVQVAPVVQTAVGAVASVAAARLPLVENVPASPSVSAPLVNCVAARVTCQPGGGSRGVVDRVSLISDRSIH
jgi:hypothetical protein